MQQLHYKTKLFTIIMATWKPNSHAEELEHMHGLMLDYERSNMDLKEKLEIEKRTEDNQIKHIHDLEKQKGQLMKKIKGLEVSLKFEKAAGEGIKRRSNTFEAEAHEYKEINKLNKEKLKYFSDQNEELLATLQHERSTRLQLLHEKHNITKEYAVLYEKYRQLEEEHRTNNIMLIDKLKSVERLMQRKQEQDSLLKLQSYEMIQLNAEILQLKECSMQVQQKLLSREKVSDTHLLKLDILQQEISHLRKELTVNAMDYTNKSYAAYQHKTPSQYPITTMVNALTANRYDTSRLHVAKMIMTGTGTEGSMEDGAVGGSGGGGTIRSMNTNTNTNTLSSSQSMRSSTSSSSNMNGSRRSAPPLTLLQAVTLD